MVSSCACRNIFFSEPGEVAAPLADAGFDKILGELEEARQIAKKARNGSAMAMCSLGKAKVQGLIIDRRETGDSGASMGDRRGADRGGEAARSCARSPSSRKIFLLNQRTD